ncbi:hypothetical protein ABIE45_002806 [Methylobacterium sp. OAE515]|uniref:hypothetical protein n=1 Tax=Methylobacterium sp. OAE515 TaxID=2817895 RepID=UPI00178AA536
MTPNDVTLITRMATDLATIAAATKAQNGAIAALGNRVKGLEDAHGTTQGDTAPVEQILATLEASSAAVAQAADSAAQTAQAVGVAAAEAGTSDQAPAEQQSAA